MSPILTDFHFIRPHFLWALIPLGLLVTMTLKHKLSRGNWADVCDEALLPYILQNKTNKTSRWPLVTTVFASVLAIIALAGPTWQKLPVPSFKNDAALVIALDLSESMNATDIKPSRLSRARFKINDILSQHKDGSIALIVYAGDAFTVTPLTHDYATIRSQLSALETTIMPSQGSNSLAAITLANQLLHQTGHPSGTILLMTDEVIASQAQKIPQLLGNNRLLILGIGTVEGAPIKRNHGGFLTDQQGNIVVPKLNPMQLADIARSGQGSYQTITHDDSDINKLLSTETEANKTTASNNHLVEKWDDQGPWLLLLVVPFAALYFRRGLLIIPVIILVHFPQTSYAFTWQDLWQNKDQQAKQAFDNNNYDDAAKQFESTQWQAAAHYRAGNYQQAADILKDASTADDLYNRGNALAKAGKLEQALDSYDQALKKDPNYSDAKANKKAVEEALKKQQQQQKQDGKSDEQSSENGNKSQQQSQNEKQNSNQKQTDPKNGSSTQSDDQKNQQHEQTESSTDKDSNSLNNDKQKQTTQENNNDNDSDNTAQDRQSDQIENNEDDKSSQVGQQSESQAENNEIDQATTQWLKRIPDDPSGLLKRKFHYQYQQRNAPQTQQEQSW